MQASASAQRIGKEVTKIFVKHWSETDRSVVSAEIIQRYLAPDETAESAGD
jgi:hypothetical protein